MKTNLDPFEVLQVPLTANKAIIDAAFRRLAKKYHPDTSLDPNAKERVQELYLARKILRNPVRRAIYQRRAEAARRPEEKDRRKQEEAEAARKRAEDEKRRQTEAESARKRTEERRKREEAEAARKRAEDEKRRQTEAESARKRTEERRKQAAAEAAREHSRAATQSQQPTARQGSGTLWIIGLVLLALVVSNWLRPPAVAETTRRTASTSNSGIIMSTKIPIKRPTSRPTKRPTKRPTARPTITSTITSTKTLDSPTDVTTLEITDSGVNLRVGPGLEYEIVLIAQDGDVAKVTGKSEDGQWYQIDHGSGNRVWVSALWSSVQGDLSNVPAVQGPVPPTGEPGGACKNLGMWTGCGGWVGDNRDVVCGPTEVGKCQDDFTWACESDPSKCVESGAPDSPSNGGEPGVCWTAVCSFKDESGQPLSCDDGGAFTSSTEAQSIAICQECCVNKWGRTCDIEGAWTGPCS